MINIQIQRIWAMPNSNTFEIKPIKELINKYICKNSIDPFANKNKLAGITNDLDKQYDTDYHMDALDFLRLFARDTVDLVLYDPPYCYDKETEIFTKEGWKSFSDLTDSDIIATLNAETNTLEYQKPLEIVAKRYRGKMVQIDSQSINLLVTPNHKMWLKRSFYGDYQFEDAKDITKTKKVWFQKACDYNGMEKDYFYLPEASFIKPNRYGEKLKEEKKIKMDLWLKFLGLFLAEGSANTMGKRGCDYIIAISQTKKETRGRIAEVLDELGYNYIAEETQFRIYDKQLWAYLWDLGKTKEKYIPEEFKNLSRRQLQILIDYMMLGDGTNIRYPKLNKKTGNMYHYTTNEYYTSSKTLMNDFCEIAIKCGYGITVREKHKRGYDTNYGVHMLGAKHFKVDTEKNTKVINDFDDFVYCVVVPNGTVLVKRKGRVVWCGSSPRQVSECYKKLDKTVNMQTTQASYWSNHKKEIGRIVRKDGIVITCGWNSGGIGKKYGFEILEILLVPHGGWHNDTIITVEKKT